MFVDEIHQEKPKNMNIINNHFFYYNFKYL